MSASPTRCLRTLVTPFVAVSWIAALGSGCFAGRPQPTGPSFATDLPPGETDGILIEWRNCAAKNPCMQGEAGDQPYKFHFADSPSVVVGTLGSKDLRFELDPSSVYRLGDHAIELRYREPTSGIALEVTWNERDQRLVDHDLLLP